VIARDAAEEWTDALAQSSDGHVRITVIAMRLGVPDALGLTLGDWQRRVFGGLVRLTGDERMPEARRLVAPVEEGGEGLSQRQAAAVLGVDETTIRRDIGSRAANAAPTPTGPAVPTRKPAANAAPDPADEERKALAELYTGMGRALQTVGGYGTYSDVRELMAKFEPDELDPPQIARAFTRDNLTAARHLIDELIEWSEA
jgi:hypothetical protein